MPSHPTPKPVIWHRRRYCPQCWKKKQKTLLKNPKQFLCKEHYRIYRSEQESARIKQKQKARKKTTGAPLYITRLGNSCLGPHAKKTPNGSLDIKHEQEKARKERKRVWDRKTPGDIAKKRAGGNPWESPEDRIREPHLKEIEDWQKPVYTPDMTGIIHYNKPQEDDIYEPDEEKIGDTPQVIDGIQGDRWEITEDVDEFFKKPPKEKEKTLAEKYKNWEY